MDETVAGWLQPFHGHLRNLAANDRFAGTVLAGAGGQIHLLAGYGVADREKGAAMRPDTRMRIASLGKMLTATAALRLVRDGSLSLETRVADLLPDHANAAFARSATVGQLLTHRSGLGDLWGERFIANRSSLRSPADYVALFGDVAADRVAGTGWRYSSLGYIVLGRMLEVASGKDYDDLVRAHVLDPAGMNDTGSPPEDSFPPRLAPGYTDADGELIPTLATLPIVARRQAAAGPPLPTFVASRGRCSLSGCSMRSERRNC